MKTSAIQRSSAMEYPLLPSLVWVGPSQGTVFWWWHPSQGPVYR
jgi:hypothetical protein